MEFITVQKAEELIGLEIQSFGTETIAFENCIGRVLAEDIRADRDFPPFDRVTMDGVAFQAAAYDNNRRKFKKEGIQYAGEPPLQLFDKNACIEVMTGCSLPKNCDSVIRYEDTKEEGDFIVLEDGLKTKINIHAKGFDRKTGDVLLPKGHHLKSTDLGVLSTVGKSQVLVNKRPSVAIITSGDELVDIDQKPLPHQIRKSNVYVIEAVLKPFCNTLSIHHIADDLDESTSRIEKLSQENDVLILCGGVSAGKKDFIPEALEKLKFTQVFHKIQQRPGKPMWFGKREKSLVFALPGNPVSAFLCTVRYVKPWLLKSAGLSFKKEKALLAAEVTFKPNLTYFIQVTTESTDGTVLATPMEGHGSGDLANLSQTDAFLELPIRENGLFKKGEKFDLYRF